MDLHATRIEIGVQQNRRCAHNQRQTEGHLFQSYHHEKPKGEGSCSPTIPCCSSLGKSSTLGHRGQQPNCKGRGARLRCPVKVDGLATQLLLKKLSSNSE